jgi:hypothetical protein
MAQNNGTVAYDIAGVSREAIEVTTAEIERSAIGSIKAEEARLHLSAVRSLQAERAELSQSAVGIARLQRSTLKQSAAAIVVANGVACDEVRTGILAAPVVRGEVHTWLDLRTAVAIGVGMALGKALLGLVAQLGKRALR